MCYTSTDLYIGIIYVPIHDVPTILSVYTAERGLKLAV